MYNLRTEAGYLKAKVTDNIAKDLWDSPGVWRVAIYDGVRTPQYVFDDTVGDTITLGKGDCAVKLFIWGGDKLELAMDAN